MKTEKEYRELKKITIKFDSKTYTLCCVIKKNEYGKKYVSEYWNGGIGEISKATKKFIVQFVNEMLCANWKNRKQS